MKLVKVTTKSGQVIEVLEREVAGLREAGLLKESKVENKTKEEKTTGETKEEKVPEVVKTPPLPSKHQL